MWVLNSKLKIDQPGSQPPPMLSTRPTWGLDSRGFNRLSCLCEGAALFSLCRLFLAGPFINRTGFLRDRRLSWDWQERFPLSHPRGLCVLGAGSCCVFHQRGNELCTEGGGKDEISVSRVGVWRRKKGCEQREGVPVKHCFPPHLPQPQKRSPGGKQGRGCKHSKQWAG